MFLNDLSFERSVCCSSSTARNKEPYGTCHNNTQGDGCCVFNSFLTFSHPSIFSLFLSLLLGLESTLIREPRESAWLPVATAKDEKAVGGEGDLVLSASMSSFTPFCIEIDRQLHTLYLPVMELSTSLEKEASTELPWRVTGITPPATPPPTLRSSREPCGSGADGEECYLKIFLFKLSLTIL